MKRFQELEESHSLNKDLNIPFLEAKGAYHIIAKICNLEYIEEGIFKSKETGIKYILTKYGFRNSVDYNYQVKYAESIRELRQLRSDHTVLESNYNRKLKGSTKSLENQLDSKNKKIRGQAEHIKAQEKKLEKQATQIKNQVKKIKELYSLINQNKDENQ